MANKRQAARRKNPLRIILPILLLAVVATAVVMWTHMQGEVGGVLEANTFYRGVYVNDMELYGMTPEQAVAQVYERASAGLDSWQVELAYGEQRWWVNADMLSMRNSLYSAVVDAVNKAFYVGRQGSSTLDKYQAIQALKDEPYRAYTGSAQANSEPVDTLLAGIAEAVYRQPQDASWYFDESRQNPIAITDEVMGQALDVEALRAQVMQMLSAMQSGTVQIVPVPMAPAVTRAAIEGQIVLLGSATTEISTRSEEDRNRNIDLGCQKLNGQRFAAGQRVSFNDVVGERTVKNGFFYALELVSGEYRMGVGGGICQVSSTLYNAVLEAGLEIITRTNHSVWTNYLPRGADATVYDGRHDFVFRNNTDADIYLLARMTTSGNKKTCVVQVYGRPDPNGYTYELVHDPEETLEMPEPEYKRDTDKTYVNYVGETHEIAGSVGYMVRSWRVTWNAGRTQQVNREDLGLSIYPAKAPVIYEGTSQP